MMLVTRVFSLSLPPQQPKSARLMSFSVAPASVYPPPSFVTKTTTVPTGQMRPPARSLLAALVLSSATTPCVCPSCGAAMETKIASTVLMSGRRTVQRSLIRTPPPAIVMSSSVQMGNVSTAAGDVMEAWTVQIDQMKPIAVSFFVFELNSWPIFNPYLSCDQYSLKLT